MYRVQQNRISKPVSRKRVLKSVYLIAMAICVVSMTVGCRNRCSPGCGNGLFAAGSPTIAPPQTYSLNIPSVARNTQPYYTPGQQPPNSNTLNPNLGAPTPATRSATQSNQSGWHGNDLSNQPARNSNQNSNEGESVLQAPTKFVESGTNNNTTTSPNTNANFSLSQQAPTRTASTAPLPGSGVSFRDSTNYTTTQVDERNDPTRLPGVDASAVRAPARNFPTGVPVQSGLVVQQGFPQAAQANYTVPVQTYVAQNGFYQRPTGYVANGVLVSQPITGYQAQPLLINPQYPVQYPNVPTSSPPTVLAQSTATITPGSSGSSTQLGWRDRDLTGRNQRF